MKCAKHHNQKAVAICKICGAGLCSDCAASTYLATACKKHIEEAHRYALAEVARGPLFVRKVRLYSLFGALLMFLGVVMMYFPMLYWLTSPDQSWWMEHLVVWSGGIAYFLLGLQERAKANEWQMQINRIPGSDRRK
jgi:hypothetical protein